MKKKILIPIYHERDYIFFYKISKKIKKHEFFFLFFFDYEKKLDLKSKNINFFDFDVNNKINKYIEKKKLIHEHLTFKKKISFLKKKYSFYYSKNIEILKKFKINLIIQELGGFVCHLSLLDAAKKLKINHYFIEPSPLTKNCFFLKNSMDQESAININKKKITKKKIKEYLNSINNKQYLAINNKDFHLNKKNMFIQIFSISTINALIKKIKNIFFGRRTEFNNLKIHCVDYLIRIKNSIINMGVKKIKLHNSNNFVYYPLHVPLDFALTHRAVLKIDQIKNLKKIFPDNFNLVLKEHPLVYSKYNYSSIIKNLKNIKVNFFNKNLSSLEISKKAMCVLTINSKSGLEFLCKKKPVFSLIKNYYTKKGLAVFVNSKRSFMKCLLRIDKFKPNINAFNNLLNNLFSKVIFFDLYNLEIENLSKSINSLNQLLDRKKI